MDNKIIIVSIFNIVASVLTCIVLKPHMFPRSLMHLPIGAFGSILIFKSHLHGIIFVYLISLYQCMELYAHLKMYNIDYSWIDLEGYLIGFSYTTVTYMYLQEYNENTI